MVEATMDVILERLNNFIARNDEDHAYIKKAIEKLTERGEKMADELGELQKWRLVFMTKVTTYSAIAIFVGSFIATIVYQIISKYI